MAPPLSCVLALATLTLLLNTHTVLSDLELHFYRNTCPQAELIVQKIVNKHALKDPSLPAGLIRLQFHDCFVRGCDASVLIDSRGDNIAEKEAPPNLTLRGFGVIDEAKEELEKKCPGIVSCADILALATRDSVALSGGSSYPLPTGRRDGRVSNLFEVHIPGPTFSLPDVLASFKKINLDLDDLTTLLGAHSIGFCHCGFFVERLYNFRGSGRPDPSLDQDFVGLLKKKCPKPVSQILNISNDPTVSMTPKNGAPFKLDSSFYKGVLQEEAVLQLDQQLAYTDLTQKIAATYVNKPNVFRKKFAKAMIKLANVGVLSGEQGEIRTNCRRVNRKANS